MITQDKAECFQIRADDNVATLLHDVEKGQEILVRGERSQSLHAIQKIQAGHKIALCPITAHAHIIKYGFPMGEATHTIAPGEWVHLHNCRSLYDSGSSSLDLESGVRKETPYV